MPSNDSMIRPDYHGGSIVNLMSSIISACGGQTQHHPVLQELDIELLRNTQNIVLLVIDGLGFNYLRSKGQRSTLHQYLQGSMTSVFPSTTATAITTFLTGMAPQQHGLTGWFTYFHEIGNIVAVLPFISRYGKVPLNEIDTNVEKLFGHTPVFDLLEIDSYIVTPQSIAYSDYSLAHSGKATIKPYDSLSQCFSITSDLIKQDSQQKYIYSYWPMLDSLAHEKGIGSKEVHQHFNEIDIAFSDFIASIKGTNTTVIVTADHGLVDSSPDNCIDLDNHPEFSKMLSIPLSGERRMAYCYAELNKTVEFRSYIHKHFDHQCELIDSNTLVDQHYFGLGPPHPQLRHRVGTHILNMKNNATIVDTIPGEKRHIHIGTHGGLSADEMLVPQIIVKV